MSTLTVYQRQYSDAEKDALLDRFMRAKIFNSVKMPFFGYLTSKMVLRIAEPHQNVPTCCVTPDCLVFINFEWASRLSDEEIRFLLCHEVLHPAMLYFVRLGNKIPAVFNTAHDHVINIMISLYVEHCKMTKDVQFIEGGCMDMKYKGMSAEEIYDLLISEKIKQNKQSGGGQNSQNGKAGKDGKDGKGDKGDKDGKGDKGDKDGMQCDCRPDLAESEVAKKAAQGDENAQRQMKQQWAIDLKAAEINHNNQKRGTLPADMLKVINDMLEPVISWKEYVSLFIGENAGDPDFSYARPSRRSEAAKAILAGTRKSGFPEVTVLWDTSGSMNGLETQILSEVQGICEELSLRIRVLLCDACLQGDYDNIENAQAVIDAGGVRGGGGSNFKPAFELLESECNDSLIIVFTDGYIEVPRNMPPTLKGVLWVLMSESAPDPTSGTWGISINVDKKGNIMKERLT